MSLTALLPSEKTFRKRIRWKPNFILQKIRIKMLIAAAKMSRSDDENGRNQMVDVKLEHSHPLICKFYGDIGFVICEKYVSTTKEDESEDIPGSRYWLSIFRGRYIQSLAVFCNSINRQPRVSALFTSSGTRVSPIA